MTIQPKISVIIPIYNVEPYLEACLTSVCNQTLHDIEILLINDCSPDNSENIALRYADQDPRVRYIKHEKNLGLGGARNTGIDAATGEFQWHIDSDDFIALDACEILYTTAKKRDLDILCFSGVNYDEDSGFRDSYFARNREICHKIMPGVDFLREARAANSFYCAIWLNLYRAEFIKGFSQILAFRENCAHQDTDHAPISFCEANRVMCLHYAPYYRLLRGDSITGTRESKKKMADKQAVTRSLLDYIQERRLPFEHPLCAFAFRDHNYFKRIYQRNLDHLRDAETEETFRDLDRIFNFIKANYGEPFLARIAG